MVQPCVSSFIHIFNKQLNDIIGVSGAICRHPHSYDTDVVPSAQEAGMVSVRLSVAYCKQTNCDDAAQLVCWSCVVAEIAETLFEQNHSTKWKL